MSDEARPWSEAAGALLERIEAEPGANEESGVKAGEVRRRDTRLVSFLKSEAKYRSAGLCGGGTRAVSRKEVLDVVIAFRMRCLAG